jgi:2-polyprenyl-6-methoxyphenol hydroxylase-like FAD-dependent oxidoreductase
VTSNPIKDVDVLIVGAGPVGMLSALALAQTGADVLVIEAEPGLNDSPRAAVYFASTLVALEDLGILEELEQEGLKIDSFGFHVPEFNFHTTISAKCMSGVTYDYSLHAGQDVIARVAMEHAKRLGADIRFSHRLAGLRQEPSFVVAEIDTPDRTVEVKAKWVIGADGARSTTRRLLGLEFEGLTWPNRFVATNVYCDFEAFGYQPENFVCDPVYGGVVALLDREGLWRLTYQEDAGTDPNTFMERLPERYAHFIPEGTPYRIKAARPYAIHQRCAERLRVGRVILAGDSAHATNPCGGLGLTTGVWTGLILSDLLGAILKGDEDEAILDRFSDERRRVFWEVTSPGASENKRIMEESDHEKRLQDIEAVKAAARDPAVARLMMMFPFRVIGDSLREGSRWANVDPTPAAGIAIQERVSQLV